MDKTVEAKIYFSDEKFFVIIELSLFCDAKI